MVRGGKYLVTLAAAGLLAAGCGTTVAGPQSPTAALAAAVSKTGTQSLRISVTVAVKSSGMSMSYAIKGAFDFARSRGILTAPAPIGLTELYIAPKAYIRYSGASASGMPLPHGKSWIEADTAKMPADSSGALGPLSATGNPRQLLSSLAGIADSERKLGTGTVRGVPATEYQLNIDAAKTAAKVPASERAGVRKFFKSLDKGSLGVDVWVDGQNLLRRIQLSLRVPGGNGLLGISGKPRVTVTMDFYDYGVPVNVSPPPASQVFSMSRQMSGISESAVGSGGAFPSASAVLIPSPSAVSG